MILEGTESHRLNRVPLPEMHIGWAEKRRGKLYDRASTSKSKMKPNMGSTIQTALLKKAVRNDSDLPTSVEERV